MIPSEFHFERPWWLLALLPAVVVIWQLASAKLHRNGWRQKVDSHLLRHLALSGASTGSRWPLWLLGIGWLSAILAMAGPSWERNPQPTAETVEPTVVVLDMSRSMDSQDISPSRLSRARYKLQDVLRRRAGGQVGLVIYAEEPFVAVPLTDDGRVIAEMIPTLTSDIMPGAGDRPDRALEQALALLEQAGAPGGHVLLITDSMGTDAAATHAAMAQVSSSGRKVSILAVGTEAGGPIPDGRGGVVRTSSGEVAQARLPRAELRELVRGAGGQFAMVTAGDADLDRLLADAAPGSIAATESLEAQEVEVWKDAGIYLLLVPLVFAPFGFRRGWVVGLLLVVSVGSPGVARAGAWDDLWSTRDQQAAMALEHGNAETAAQLFESEEWRAAAQYESGDYESARQAYAGLTGVANQYNHGNALARAGQLEDAVAAFEDVLREEPEHEDARFNRDLVQRLLDQKQQESSSESGASDSAQQSDANQEQASSDPSGQEGGSSGEEPGQEGGSSDQESGQEGGSSGEESGQEGGSSDQESGEEGASPGESADRSENLDEDSAPGALQQEVDEALEREAERPMAESGGDSLGRVSPEALTEEQQAREQLLRQIPDDPSGLLRAKIYRKYAERRYAEQRRQLLERGETSRWW